VSPFRTGQYAAQTTKSVYGHAAPNREMRITLKEVGFRINIDNISAKTLD